MVWLTPDPAVALTAGFPSLPMALLPGLATALVSDFLFVTDTFNCPEACLLAARGADFTREADTCLEASRAPAVSIFFVAVLGAALAAIFVVTAPLSLAAVLAATFPAVTIALTGADLITADFAFFAEDVRVFAGFFIAFAMGSIPTVQVLDDGVRHQQGKSRILLPTLPPMRELLPSL